jgi:Zn-dependent peptidase ImmA (M78 family)/transcriptional regulator with XRE-family HTH domain
MFNPERLTLARQRRGLNKSALAERLGVSARTVTAYERGESEPLPENLAALADVLNFPERFFEEHETPIVPPDGASFRALSRMTARQRDAALGAGALCILLEALLSREFELPVVDIPDLDQVAAHHGPEHAAAAVRARWGLGHAPIPNVLHLVEKHGIRVFSLVEEAHEVDAFSFWHDGTPFICLNTLKTAEHSVFDVAHELGHIVMHRSHHAPRGRREEDEANQFASAFLMPLEDVRVAAPAFPNLEDLANAKTRWGVSVAALNFRLHRLGLTTDWHYREMCIELSRRGRKNEPNPQARQRSQLLEKVFSTLRAEGVTKSQIAGELNIDTNELEAMVFGLVTTVLEGGNQPLHSLPSRPDLRLV